MEEESKEKTTEVEDEEEEGEEAPPPPPPAPPVLWAYKPADWDDEELHLAYNKYPYHELQLPLEDTKFPPDTITVTLLDIDNGKEEAPRTIQADHKNEKFDLTDFPRPILFVNYRYVSTNCRLLCEDYVEDTRYIILLSVRLMEEVEFPEDCYILNYFIRPESADHALDIINFFQFHITMYYRKKTEEAAPTELLEFIRPKLLRKCEVKVHWRKYRKTWTEERIVVLDPECVAFYRKPFADVHNPRDSMFFWLEQFRKTVCKVSRVKSENCFVLHSLFMFVTLNYDEESAEVEEAFASLKKATPRKAFADPKIFYQWLLGNYDPETGKIRPPQPKVEPVVLDEEEVGKLNCFEKELYEGLELFQVNDDQAQKIWNNIRPQLEHNLENNTLPKFEDPNFNQDPNSVEGLMEGVAIIERELFTNVDYNKALAITVAMRTVFLKSGVERLREMMTESAVDFLHKIHTRGNASVRRSATVNATNQQPLDECLVHLEDVEEEYGEEFEGESEEDMEEDDY